MPDSLKKNKTMMEIMEMAGPVFIELIMGTLFGMVDMIMLGRYGGEAVSVPSIAAVGITNQLMFIGLSLVQSLNIGATTMVARYIGAGKEERIESVIRHVIILTQVLLVIPILYLGIVKTDSTMKFIGAHQDSIDIGRKYFQVIALGFIFQAFNFSIFAALRGAGETKIPMKINLIVNLLNVVGNAILIYGLFGMPELGILGAGVSTSLSHVVASILLVIIIFSKKSIITINLRERFRFNKDIIYNLVKIGVPASMEQIALRVGILLFGRIVSSLGTVAYATHQICINIMNLSFTPGQAFGIAASALTGRSLGEKKPHKAEEYIKLCGKIGAVVSTMMAVVFFVFGGRIASLYTESQDVINEAARILKVMAFIQPFQSSQLIIAGGLRGAGDTVWTLISTFIGILLVRVALANLFVKVIGIGLIGAWLAVLIDQAIRWFLILFRFRTGKWKYVTIR